MDSMKVPVSLPMKDPTVQTQACLKTTVTPLTPNQFFRPLKVEFLKETKEAIIQEDLDSKEEIENLLPFKIIFSNNHCVYIKYRIYLPVIDGKELNALTETKSFQACLICKGFSCHTKGFS